MARLEEVEVQLGQRGFKVAYVVFDKPSGLQAALRLSSHKTQVLSTSESPIVCGIMKWCKQYNTRIVDPELLQKDIDGFMKTYDQKANENDARDKQAMEEDNEGWITVTNK
uniref:Ribosomal RNA-processing protein 7 C-terminal domain-containing protein n=1 Tax=Timema tahoe TaxID=61484 RepID=A0A7R9P1P5_9NEOP|nr:unnamed protein product [Timema tahoe]